ncbi:GNAT family N-acetyltransferase [Desulfosporosinus acidiphilus]|uniref:GNAT family N-acetyltransferase n=1 Tax=Desulfosporosinus acidiphilus TaxID=885581 RepID=UPI000257A9FE|nr:GNAT family N-acetyltransferase [Desulfosporosinus acidiphilus]
MAFFIVPPPKEIHLYLFDIETGKGVCSSNVSYYLPNCNERSIVIAQADEGIAQLRYFLLEPETRGAGLGRKLVDMALAFCREKGYKQVFLETICFLEAARHIYASKGFKITKTHKNPSWGDDVIEEHWDLLL